MGDFAVILGFTDAFYAPQPNSSDQIVKKLWDGGKMLNAMISWICRMIADSDLLSLLMK